MSSDIYVGVHLIVNLYNVPDVEILKTMEVGLPILQRVVADLDLHVMSETGHQFFPMGWSYAFVLSESHFTIHTYPEHRSCYLDIFCCNKDFNANHAVHVIKSHFQMTDAIFQILRR